VILRSGLARRLRAALPGLLALFLGCASGEELPAPGFVEREPARPYTPSKALQEFEASENEPYKLGEGDMVAVQVWEKSDLSGNQVIGPDGAITVPVIGTMRIAGMTREDAAASIAKGLSKFYTGVSVTVKVEQYVANRITVVGRVKSPGVLRFEKSPTLLEVIARAGGFPEAPVNAPPVNLTHCAVIRGRDKMAWIDLKSLSDGREPALNLRLRADDLVLVPEDGDLPIYVLGQVARPGPLRFVRGMTFLDAIAQAGGPSRDSLPSNILLVRPSQNRRVVVSIDDILGPVNTSNVALENGDIIYVPTNILADVGYLLEKLNPWSWFFAYQTVRNPR
jgi:polysaccharide export outer membrane protein